MMPLSAPLLRRLCLAPARPPYRLSVRAVCRKGSIEIAARTHRCGVLGLMLCLVPARARSPRPQAAQGAYAVAVVVEARLRTVSANSPASRGAVRSRPSGLLGPHKAPGPHPRYYTATPTRPRHDLTTHRPQPTTTQCSGQCGRSWAISVGDKRPQQEVGRALPLWSTYRGFRCCCNHIIKTRYRLQAVARRASQN